jgi:hypothetical protein
MKGLLIVLFVALCAAEREVDSVEIISWYVWLLLRPWTSFLLFGVMLVVLNCQM